MGTTLWEALAVREGDVVAAVGGGGKTFLVYRLVEEAADRGLTGIVTTTTRMTSPERGGLPPTLLSESLEEILAEAPARLTHERRLLVAAGRGKRSRFLGFEPGDICNLREAAKPSVLAIEADGSAHRPFKAPADHEPVVPPCSTIVVACVGLEVLGRPLDDSHVHRPEIVSELAGAAIGEPVSPALVGAVLAHPLGGRKSLPEGARFAVLLNGVSEDTLDSSLEAAGAIQAAFVAGPRPPVLLTDPRAGLPVRALLP